jgi:glycosyltransferase involved in cell wall biosynthesis
VKSGNQQTIIHIIKGLGRGGAERMILSAVRNHPVPVNFHVVYFYSLKGHLSAELTGSGATVHHLAANNPVSLFFKLPALIQLLRRIRPDVIHAHLPLTGFISLIAAGFMGTPLLYTEHNLPSRYRLLTGWLHRFTLRYCKNIIAVSDAVLKDLNRIVPHTPARLLANGVDTEFFDPSHFSKDGLRREFNIPESRIVIGTVAVFTRQKRLDRWIEICKRVRAVNPSAFFILAGHGPLQSDLLEHARDLIENNCLMFAGKIDQPEKWMAAMDIYLMSSDFEGLPVALLEAMSLELPVVVTPVGGISSAVEDNVNGFHYPTENPEQAVNQILRLIADRDLRTATGKAARRTVSEKFDIRQMTAVLQTIYTDLAKRN